MRSGWPRRRRLAATAAALLVWGAAQAAVDVNHADRAALERVKGVGPTLSTAILEARAQAPFRDWADLLRRVKGLGAASAARLSDAGLTVNGAAFAPVAGIRVAPP
ncbi:MAG: helix-hairpin-helix domain-containing protein [Ideonella sp.]|nr:helix-hairpin-helix domain-containing protein [Ideonella sp.]